MNALTRMRALSLWMYVSFLFSAVSLCQEPAAVIQSGFEELPACGLNCIVPVLIKLKCDVNNITSLSRCLCLNLEAESTIADCVLTNCNYSELVKVEKSQYELCYFEPKPSRSASILAVTIMLACVVTISVALRCWSRYTVSKEFWWDDWFLLVSTSLFLAMQAVNIWGVKMGFGVHVWNVNPDLNVQLYQYEWIYEIFYLAVNVSSKISVLLLYYRIFPQDWLRRTIFVGCAYMVVHGLVFLFIILFQCRPLALVFDKSISGTCLDIHSVVLWGSILSMAEDLVAISLPIPSILKLHLPLRKKVQVVLVMSVGLIAVLASMIRMKFVVHFYYSIDINWDDYGIAILSMIEVALSLICVCFPAVKLLFSKHFSAKPVDSSTVNNPGSLRLISSYGSRGSQSEGFIKSIRRKASTLFGRSQFSVSRTDLDEERPQMTEI